MIVLRPKSLESRIESSLNLIRKKQKIYGAVDSKTLKNKVKTEAFVSFDELRMMCYFGLTQALY